MRIAVFGSRTLRGNRVTEVIDKYVKQMGGRSIETASEPRGVCEAARHYAKANCLPLTVCFLDDGRAAGEYHWRSVQVYENCDMVLLIHDGKSKGTENERKLAIKMGIPHEYVQMEVLDDIDEMFGTNMTTIDDLLSEAMQ